MLMKWKSLCLIRTTQNRLVQYEIPLTHHRHLLLRFNWIKLKIIVWLSKRIPLSIDRSWHLLRPKLIINSMYFNIHKVLQVSSIPQRFLIQFSVLLLHFQKRLVVVHLRPHFTIATFHA